VTGLLLTLSVAVAAPVREAVALDPQRRAGEPQRVEGFNATRWEPRAVSLHR
jgi:hypothetical protein